MMRHGASGNARWFALKVVTVFLLGFVALPLCPIVLRAETSEHPGTAVSDSEMIETSETAESPGEDADAADGDESVPAYTTDAEDDLPSEIEGDDSDIDSSSPHAVDEGSNGDQAESEGSDAESTENASSSGDQAKSEEFDAESTEDTSSSNEPIDDDSEEASLVAMASGNNSITNAQSISLNTYVYGTMSSTTDQHFYKVYIPSAGRYTLSFVGDTQIASNGFMFTRWTVKAYDPNRNVLIEEDHMENDLSRSAWTASFPVGYAYVQVYSEDYFGRLTPGSSYHLRVSREDYVPTDNTSISQFKSISSNESENNNLPSSANLIAANTYVYGKNSYTDDVDFYAVRIPVAGRYTLSFVGDTQIASNGDMFTRWIVKAYDFDRNVLIDDSHMENDLSSTSWTAFFPAGIAYIHVYSDDYFGKLTVGSAYHLRLSAEKISISNASITGIENRVYNGKAQTQYVTVYLNGKSLVKNNDYTVSHKNNVDIGTATVTIKGIGNYTGSVSKTFKIVAPIPAWYGASRMPVGSTADYKVTNGGWIRLKVNGKWATSDSVVSLSAPSNTTKRVTAKKAGTTTLYLFDAGGKMVTSRKVTVYSLSGSWELQSAVNSRYVLDIRGKSKANSARMIVWPRNNGKNQRYQFVKQSDGTYGIKCVHSGKYVDVKGGGTKKSQPVIQYTWNGGKNQRWKIAVDAENRVTFVSAKSGMVFDIQGGKVTKRAQMIQYPFNSGLNQKWVLNKK